MNNYPIKYTLMPIYEESWDSVEICGYIVSKCFLVSETIKYISNGEKTTEYEVVFPYRIEDNTLRRIYPTYHLVKDICTNSVKVDFIFDSFEEAKNKANNLNEILSTDYMTGQKLKDNSVNSFIELKELFMNRINKYAKYEEIFNELTDDLNVNKQLKKCIK